MSNYMIYLVPAYAIGLFILINKSNVKEKYRYYQMQNVIILFIISLIFNVCIMIKSTIYEKIKYAVKAEYIYDEDTRVMSDHYPLLVEFDFDNKK